MRRCVLAVLEVLAVGAGGACGAHRIATAAAAAAALTRVNTIMKSCGGRRGARAAAHELAWAPGLGWHVDVAVRSAAVGT